MTRAAPEIFERELTDYHEVIPLLRCLYAASEVTGFAKTGGLADVASSLPLALAERGVDVAVVMPLYRGISQRHCITDTGLSFQVPVGDRQIEGRIWRGTLSASTVPIFFIDQPEFFDRHNNALGGGIYQYVDAAGRLIDYGDNCARFIFFNRAIFEAMRLLQFWPDILHLNDWQTGMAPVYLREYYDCQASYSIRPRYQQIRTVLTIHNVAYQGVFWKEDMPLTGLPWRLFNFTQLEFYDHLSFLKAGIAFADTVNTVSPTYAREIQTPYFGWGMQGALRTKHCGVQGIVNGVDYRVWDPATDSHLAAKYDATSLEGKAVCKAALQEQCGLEKNAQAPLLGLISRLVAQKGIDLLIPIAPQLLNQGVQIVVLGQGDAHYHHALADLQRQFPGRIVATTGVDEILAHRIEAGADMFLMPSRYEPCGLNQLYSLKYGTLPIVRATGGLADTVVDATGDNIAAGKATGFTFQAMAPAALLETCQRALKMFREQSQQWRDLQRIGMTQDWSWSRSAAEYISLYTAVDC